MNGTGRGCQSSCQFLFHSRFHPPPRPQTPATSQGCIHTSTQRQACLLYRLLCTTTHQYPTTLYFIYLTVGSKIRHLFLTLSPAILCWFLLLQCFILLCQLFKLNSADWVSKNPPLWSCTTTGSWSDLLEFYSKNILFLEFYLHLGRYVVRGKLGSKTFQEFGKIGLTNTPGTLYSHSWE